MKTSSSMSGGEEHTRLVSGGAEEVGMKGCADARRFWYNVLAIMKQHPNILYLNTDPGSRIPQTTLDGIRRYARCVRHDSPFGVGVARDRVHDPL